MSYAKRKKQSRKRPARCNELSRIKTLVLKYERKLRSIQCMECYGTELKHKPTCEWRD